MADTLPLRRLPTEAGVLPALVIGARGRDGRRASYSNWGQPVDAYFPGNDIRSTAAGGGYRPFGGTSAAAAIAAGYLALMLADQPELPLAALARKLAALGPEMAK